MARSNPPRTIGDMDMPDEPTTPTPTPADAPADADRSGVSENPANTTDTGDEEVTPENLRTARETAERAHAVDEGDEAANDMNEARRRRLEPQAYVLVSDDEAGEGDARRVDVEGSVTSPPEGVRFATPEQINRYNQARLDDDDLDTDGVDVTPTSFRP